MLQHHIVEASSSRHSNITSSGPTQDPAQAGMLGMGNLSDSGLFRLRASIRDKKMESLRYKQTQLQNLHKSLQDFAEEICVALGQDTEASAAEIETEFYLTMTLLRHYYESIDLANDLKEGHLISAGVDNVSRRVGVGLVLIWPTTYTRLFSVISPAIAAGNCICLQLEGPLVNIDGVLKRLVLEAFDKDTFCLTGKQPPDLDSARCTLVDQTSQTTSNLHVLSSNSKYRVIAVVDKTADIDAAALSVATARFTFQGMSPYAPDLVIVDEFIKKDFFQACIRYGHQVSSAQPTAEHFPSESNEETWKDIKDCQERGQASCLKVSNFMLVDISDRNACVTKTKIRGRYLTILSTKILGGDLMCPLNQKLLAGYFFADPKVGKFLSQQIDCHISCINQIPIHLLVGPAAPADHPPSFDYRYSKEMFSRPQPQYIQRSLNSLVLGTMLRSVGSKGRDTFTGGKGIPASSMRTLAMAPLPLLKDPAEKKLGFFEEGFVRAALFLAMAAPVVGYGVWVLGWKGWGADMGTQ